MDILCHLNSNGLDMKFFIETCFCYLLLSIFAIPLKKGLLLRLIKKNKIVYGKS